jgi:hypothetical protein
LLTALASQPLQLVMDGSVVGRGCIALMMSVVRDGRALPLCSLVVRGKKGHFPEDVHRALLAQVQALLPPRATVSFVGDGEFDGTELQAALREYHWQYVCGTAANIIVTACGVSFHLSDFGPPCGESVAVTPAFMTAEAYGPISMLAVWEQRCEEPLYLVTNMTDLDEALRKYKKRPHIETFFSDLKSRIFHIHKSHLRDPAPLSRLLIAACLAYLWMYLLNKAG